MKLISIIIKESRKEDLKKKYSDKFDEETLDWILGISDLQEFNHKYTDWVLKNTSQHSVDNDIEILLDAIKTFDKYQSTLEKKDINQYSYGELAKELLKIEERKKEKELEKQANKIYEDDKFLVVKPETEEASCKYGSNTKWCVTSKGSGHFGRYTQGQQALYFIINKTNSTNQNYSKVAVHFADSGNKRYWDTQDSPLSPRETEILEYAFPEMIEAINKDYEKVRVSSADKILIETFDSVGEYSKEIKNYLKSSYDLSVIVNGFENNPDMDFGHSTGWVTISLIDSKSNSRFFDEYQMFIIYKSKDSKSFTASIGFMSNDDIHNVDLGLEGWEINSTYNILKSIEGTAENVRSHIAHMVLDHIEINPKLAQKVGGETKVWRKNLSSGYTFGRNKGLIKKLVDYLDSGYDNGTKLDFLEYIGTIKSRVVDGKKEYARSGTNTFLNPNAWKGQYSSFFSAAVLSGIIQYQKEGRRFIIKPGPNFDAFKKGELKAI